MNIFDFKLSVFDVISYESLEIIMYVSSYQRKSQNIAASLRGHPLTLMARSQRSSASPHPDIPDPGQQC